LEALANNVVDVSSRRSWRVPPSTTGPPRRSPGGDLVHDRALDITNGGYFVDTVGAALTLSRWMFLIVGFEDVGVRDRRSS
jgi:hypothetical protein